MADYGSRLADSVNDSNNGHGFLHDVLLLGRCIFMISATSCDATVQRGESPHSALMSHSDSLCTCVMDHLLGVLHEGIPLLKVVTVGSRLWMAQPLTKNEHRTRQIPGCSLSKRGGKACSLNADISHPRMTLLRMMCETTHDLAVIANAAVDALEEFTCPLEGGSEYVNSDLQIEMVSGAMKVCKTVQQAVMKLLSMYLNLLVLSSDSEIEVNSVLQSGGDVALCSKLSVQAIFRGKPWHCAVYMHVHCICCLEWKYAAGKLCAGMCILNMPGDAGFLFSSLGTCLAVLHASCNANGALSDAQDDLHELATATLTCSVFLDTDAVDATDGLAGDKISRSSPVQSHEEAVAVTGMLIEPSVLIVGCQIEAESNKPDGLPMPVSWIFHAISQLDAQVRSSCKAVETILMEVADTLSCS